MKPRKKSNSSIIIYGMIYIFVLYCTLTFALAYEWAVANPIIEVKYQGTSSEYENIRFNVMGLIEKWGVLMSESPSHITINQYTIKFVAISSFIYLILLAYYVTTRRKYISGMEYGSAKWGDNTQITSIGWKSVKKLLIERAKTDLKNGKKLLKTDKSLSSFEKNRLIAEKENKTEKKIENLKNNINENTEIILAQNVSFSIFNQEINNNVLIYGGSGAGKSRNFLMPNILNLAGTTSFVITDPKGEIYMKARYFLQQMGYKVRCINLFEKTLSSHYNPLYYIHTERENYDWQEDVLTLIDTMIINLDGGEGRKGSDPFWDDSARHFIQSLFFFTMYMCEPQDRNMNQVMWLLGQLEIGDDEDDFNSPLDQLFELLKSLHGEDNIAYRTFKDFRTKASGKTAKSIAMTMVAKLQPYNIASVQALSEYDELQLDKIGEELTALFVIVPPVSKTFNFVAGMVFTQTFQELNYCANALHGGRLPIPVFFGLDEFANTAVIPNFPQIIAYARSLGFCIAPILQSRSQLKGMYEKEWEVISDNCASTLFLGSINSEETLKAFSERLGKGTFDEKDVSVSKGRSSSTSTSNKKIGRELLTPAEIANLPKNDCLVFIAGKDPMYCEKYNYPKHKNYKYTTDFDDRYINKFVEDIQVKNPYREDERRGKAKIDEIIESLNIPNMSIDSQEVERLISETYFGNWDIEENYVFEDVELGDVTVEKEIILQREKTINDYSMNIEKLWENIDTNLPSMVTLTQNSQEVENLIDEISENIEFVEIEENYILEDDFDFIDDVLDSAKNLTDEMAQVEQIQNSLIDLELLNYSCSEDDGV